MFLSVGIPTFNGEQFLEAVVESIVSQEKNVEIVISDNASTDSTWDIICKLEKKHPQIIRPHKNQKNMGFDANVDQVVKMAVGKFVWVLSDDDSLLPGSLDKVLSVISKHPKLSLIFVDHQNSLKMKHPDTLCRDGNDFFRRIRFKNGLISSNIVNRERWGEVPINSFFGCQWIQFVYSIYVMSPFFPMPQEAYIISETLLQRHTQTRWGENGGFIYTGLKAVRVFEEIPKLGYDKDIKKIAISIIRGGYYKNIPRAKLAGLKVTSALLSEMYALYKYEPGFWLMDLPLLFIPRFLYKQAHKILRLYACA